MNLIFDFDSTLFPFESLEDLITQSIPESIDKKKIQTEISLISDAAMNGDYDFKASLEKRIHLTNLSLQDIENYYHRQKNAIDTRIIQLILDLQNNHHQVFVLSGGFLDYVLYFCHEQLSIPKEHIFANQFQFNQQNQVIGFDKTNFLAESDGKMKLIQSIKEFIPNEKIIMIGDGYTDWLVYENQLADEFIGIGYYQIRPKVKEKAMKARQKFITNIDDLCDYLNKKQINN